MSYPLQKQIDDLGHEVDENRRDYDLRLRAVEGRGPKRMSHEERNVFDGYARWVSTGVKAASTDSGPAGGYAVQEIVRVLMERYARPYTPMRNVCRIGDPVPSLSGYRAVVDKLDPQAGWFVEGGPAVETVSPELGNLTPGVGTVYAMPGASKRAVESMTAPRAGDWLARAVAFAMGTAENIAFTTGTGVNRPSGVLAATLSTDVDGTRAFGQIQKVHSGSSGAFVADKLVELVCALDARYHENARWMLHPLSLQAIWKLTNASRMLVPVGGKLTLLGYPITLNGAMPSPAAGANAAIFGDFESGYEIVDTEAPMRILRDAVTNRDFMYFFCTKDVAGHVIDDRALKVQVLDT